MPDIVHVVGGDAENGHDPLRIDETASANAAVVIDAIHNRIHRGQFFLVDQVNVALADAGVLDFLIRVTTACHLRPRGSCGGNARLQLFDAPTTSADGSSVTPVQRNRFSSKAPVTLFFTGPTVTVPGTVLMDNIIGGGVGKTASGGEGQSFEEYVLDPGDYLARITNISGLATPTHIQLDFYEDL